MSALSLEQHNRPQLAQALGDDTWLVACLCAAWCGVCREYRPAFDQLAARHPDKVFMWVDVEDQADLVGDLEVEDFPVLLIQRGDTVAFYGTTLPDAHQANRLLQAQVEKSAAELQAEAGANAERRAWQRDCNLRQKLLASS